MTILITTPRGKVGSQIVRNLQAKGAKLRLGAHAVDATKRDFPGVEVVRLDYAEPATLDAAVRGVDAVYLAAPADQPAEPEERLVDAAKRAGVKKLVKLSAMGVDANDAAPLRRVEKYVEASGIPWTIVRPTWFDQNFSTSMAAGIKSGTLAEPAADGKIAFVDTRDIAAVAAAALTEDGHDGKVYTLTGPELLDRAEVAAILSREIGRPVAYVDVTDAQFRAAVKDFLSPAYLELMSTLYGGVRAGWFARTTDDVEKVLGRKPIAFAQFAKDERAAWA